MKIGIADVDAVIFDFDGTLADSMWVWDDVDRKFLAKRNIPFTAEYGEMIAVLGFELGAEFSIEHFGLDEKPEDIIAEWQANAADGYATQVMLKPGAKDYLKYCKSQGIPIAIATSLQRYLLEPALKNNGVFGMFDAICVCDELKCGGKASPAVYEEAARQLGVPVNRCAIFEDVVTPAKSAKQTGAYVVGVYDEHKQQATEELGAICDLFILDFYSLISLR